MRAQTYGWLCVGLIYGGITALGAEIRYTIVDLGVKTQAQRLNNAGEVTGTINQAPHGVIGFFYSHGEVHEITRSDGATIIPKGLNDAGVVIGEARAPRKPGPGPVSPAEPFIYTDGKLSTFMIDGRAAGVKLRSVIDINNAGAVLAQTEERPSRLVVISDGNIKPLVLPSGMVPDDMTAIYDPKRIDDIGRVLTTVHGVKWGKLEKSFVMPKNVDGPAHALLFDNGTVTDLGEFRAVAFNRKGEVVGTIALPGQKFHVGLTDEKGLQDLGIPPGFETGHADGINASGQIVATGSTTVGGGFAYIDVNSHAFLYEQGKWLDLNDLVDFKNSGVKVLFAASAINDRGQILCQAIGPATYHAVLLTPIAQSSATLP